MAEDDLVKDLLTFFRRTFGADETQCPYCGADVSCWRLFDEDEFECPKCRKKFKYRKKSQN